MESTGPSLFQFTWTGKACCTRRVMHSRDIVNDRPRDYQVLRRPSLSGVTIECQNRE